MRCTLAKPILSRLLAETRAAAAVEFAFALPVLLLAMLGVLEFGRALWYQNALHYAVEEAARCVTINTTVCSSPSATQSFAATRAGLNFSNSVFTVTTAGCGNQVSASYPFQTLTLPVSGSSSASYSFTLTAQSCFPS
ncbi:MAG TPA: TadE family protein [Stellaceae bacterium]|nr:TadE family protein [Stellaceae bacterium]